MTRILLEGISGDRLPYRNATDTKGCWARPMAVVVSLMMVMVVLLLVSWSITCPTSFTLVSLIFWPTPPCASPRNSSNGRTAVGGGGGGTGDDVVEVDSRTLSMEDTTTNNHPTVNVTTNPSAIDIVRLLDESMNDMLAKLNIRGASVAFFDRNFHLLHGRPILRGYGKVASSDDSANVTPDTVFMMASVSKVFTGTAILQLIDLGFIPSLDDDICHVLPNVAPYLPSPNSACRHPEYPNVPVTWRMLVTHTSSLLEDVPETADGVLVGYGSEGMDDYCGLAGGGPCPLGDEVVAFYRDFLLDKATETSVGETENVNWYQLGQDNGGAWIQGVRPGTEVIYSNFAVGYLAALTELALSRPPSNSTSSKSLNSYIGMTFREFTNATIFHPLKMNCTAWYSRDIPTGTVMAVPVYYDGKSFSDIGDYCFIDYASGSLYTSVSDLSQFLSSMVQNYGVDKLWPDRTTGLQAVTCQEPSRVDQQNYDCEFGVNWAVITKAATKETNGDDDDNNDDDGNNDDDDNNNNNDDNNNDGNYALPWLTPLSCLDWSHGAYHDGYEAGVQTLVVILPQAGIYAAVLTNTDGNTDRAAEGMMENLLRTITGGDCNSYRRTRQSTKEEGGGQLEEDSLNSTSLPSEAMTSSEACSEILYGWFLLVVVTTLCC